LATLKTQEQQRRRPEVVPNINIERFLTHLRLLYSRRQKGAFAVNDYRPASESKATVVDSYLSPEACRAKALECRIKADMLDDPREKALMLHYVEWWTRLAELAQNNKDQNI